jgi:hypothetical protein
MFTLDREIPEPLHVGQLVPITVHPLGEDAQPGYHVVYLSDWMRPEHMRNGASAPADAAAAEPTWISGGRTSLVNCYMPAGPERLLSLKDIRAQRG